METIEKLQKKQKKLVDEIKLLDSEKNLISVSSDGVLVESKLPLDVIEKSVNKLISKHFNPKNRTLGYIR